MISGIRNPMVFPFGTTAEGLRELHTAARELLPQVDLSKVIRSFVKGFLPPDKVINLYIPKIAGKEKRKKEGSKEGTLGVEGMDADLLRALFQKYADASTERGKALRKAICDKFHFTSLEFQTLEGVIKAIGIEPCKLCTYCWNGKE